MKILFVALILTITTNLYADYGWAYYFKCKVVTKDSTLTGFIKGPYEYLSDSVLVAFRKNGDFFQRKLLQDLKSRPDPEAPVEILDFAYVHNYPEGQALYRSKNTINIKITEIKSVKLYSVVIFRNQPRSVISALLPQDTVWCKHKLLTKIEDKEIDPCVPNEFLVYDDKVNYTEIIHQVMREKDPAKREKLLQDLRRYKIVALQIGMCG